MNGNPAPEYLRSLVAELCKLPVETGWVEFKENNANPQDIGEYLSALSNAAALQGQANGYVVWGVKDTSREVVGTNFQPGKSKVGNEDLVNWLIRLLSP